MSELAHRIELTAKDQKIAELEQKVAELSSSTMYQTLLKRIDDLKEIVNSFEPYKRLLEAKENNQALEAQCSKMRAALDKYGSHASECSCFEYDPKECNCGYEQALSKGEME